MTMVQFLQYNSIKKKRYFSYDLYALYFMYKKANCFKTKVLTITISNEY